MGTTGIIVKTKKEVKGNGVEGFRVTKVQCLAKSKLPDLYLEGLREVVFLPWIRQEIGSGLQLFRDGRRVLGEVCVNNFYSPEKMEEINKHIRAAGQHLTEVNAKLADKRSRWHGAVTFKDGIVKNDVSAKKERKRKRILWLKDSEVDIIRKIKRKP